MRRTVEELAAQAERKLVELGYAPGTIQRYKTTWSKVERWCSDRDIEGFGSDEEIQLIRGIGLADNVLSHRNRTILRHIRTLLSVDQGRGLPSFSRPLSDEMPDRFRSVFGAYTSYLAQRDLAPGTRRSHICVIRKFMTGLSIERISDLSMGDVTAHMEACSWMTGQTRAGILYTIRTFVKWAASAGWCSSAVAGSMPIIPGHKHSSLPSAYAASEVAAMVAATGGGCPRRDRTVLLLASVLGLRAGDIRALRLGNIDWRAREVRFTQAKTGNPVRLPLPDEVVLALADYLRNERLESADDHVFLHHRAPHHSFEGVSNPFHYVATAAFERAAVDTSGKRHGLHSLRHSAATNMLSGGTPYPVISGILGHSNANTTRTYMAIDIERLRPFSLEVPRG